LRSGDPWTELMELLEVSLSPLGPMTEPSEVDWAITTMRGSFGDGAAMATVTSSGVAALMATWPGLDSVDDEEELDSGSVSSPGIGVCFRETGLLPAIAAR